MRDEIDEAVSRAVSSGWYIGGPECDVFEQQYAEYTNAAACVGVANGLDALQLALRACKIGSDDEVIVASNSYIATLLAISSVGATPVLVEPDPLTFNLNPARVEEAITPRTRAILPTHLYGQPADLEPLLSISRRKGLRLIEDAAQAHGARYQGDRIGAHGDIVCWSFYPSKNLGALGDAGAITTNDSELAQLVRVLGNYGSSVRYVNEMRGVNSRLDPIHAAVLSVKLNYLDEWNARRLKIVNRYLSELSDCDLQLPFAPSWTQPAWHLFVVRSDVRNELLNHLTKREIQTLIHYPIPPHLQRAYADLRFTKGDYPVAELLANEVVSLPVGPHMTDPQIDEVIAAVRSFSA